MNPIRSLVWFSRTRHITTVGNFLQLLIFLKALVSGCCAKGYPRYKKIPGYEFAMEKPL